MSTRPGLFYAKRFRESQSLDVYICSSSWLTIILREVPLLIFELFTVNLIVFVFPLTVYLAQSAGGVEYTA